MTHVVHDFLISRVLRNMKMCRDTNMVFVIIETGMGESGSEWVRVSRSNSEWVRVSRSGSEWVRVGRSGWVCKMVIPKINTGINFLHF